MKKLQIAGFSALTLLGSMSAMHAQATTTPVGYTTETLAQGFNLIGLTLHQPVSTSGAFTTVADVGVTDTNGDFITALGASGSATYILEIKTGALAGSIQDITEWTATTLTTPDDLLAAGALATDTYSIRKATTIADAFGESNTAGFLAGNASSADIIWIPNGSGGFDKFYYAVNFAPILSAGWKNVATGNTDQSDKAIVYADGILVERKGVSDLSVTFTGSVKDGDTSIFISDDYTYAGASYPAGVTLDSSNLANSMQAGNASSADLLWMADGAGGYTKFYYAVDFAPILSAGWKNVATGNTDQGATNITSGMIIQKRASTAFTAKISGPSL
jgi:hypothetical protein